MLTAFGPHDLSCSAGIPKQYQHPLLEQALATIITKARAKNMGAAIHFFYPDGLAQEIDWIKKGANLILHSGDIMAFKETCKGN